MAKSNCIRLTDKNFKEKVLKTNMPVLVDFWGSWCPPCKMIEPVIDELAEQLRGTVKVGKLNVDQNPKTRSMFKISASPTFIVFQYGKVMGRAIGSMSKKQLLQIIETALLSLKQRQPIEAVPDRTSLSGKTAGAMKEI